MLAGVGIDKLAVIHIDNAQAAIVQLQRRAENRADVVHNDAVLAAEALVFGRVGGDDGSFRAPDLLYDAAGNSKLMLRDDAALFVAGDSELQPVRRLVVQHQKAPVSLDDLDHLVDHPAQDAF